MNNSDAYFGYDNSLDNHLNTEEANANLELALKFVQSQSGQVDNGNEHSFPTEQTQFDQEQVSNLLNQAQQHQQQRTGSQSNDDEHSDYYQEDEDLPRKRGPGRPRKSRGLDDDGRPPRKARAPRVRDEVSKSTKGKYALLRDKAEVDEDKRYLDEHHGIVMTTGQAVLQSHISRILLAKISEAGIGQASGEAYGRLPNGFTANPSTWLEPHGCDISGWPDGLPPTAIGGWTNHQLYAVLRLLLEDPNNITIYRTDGKPAIPPRPFQGKRRSATVSSNSPARKRTKKKASSVKMKDTNSLGVGTSSAEADAQAAAAAAAALQQQQQHFHTGEPSTLDLDHRSSHLFDIQFSHNGHINDGICEEECCDGTDEPAGICPDTCKQRGKQYKVELEHSERIRDKALITKSKYIDSAKKELNRLSSVQQDKTRAIIKAGERELAAKAEVDRLEALSKDALSAKLASPLYKHLLDARSTLDDLKKENEAVEADLSHLLDILESLKNSYNPNYQDMGVLAAVKDYNAYVDTRKKRSASNELLSKLQNEDLVNLIVSLDQSSGDKKDDIDSMLFNIEAYLPPTMVDNYRAFKETFVGWLVKFSIIPEPSTQGNASYIQNARKEHKKANDALQKARNGLAKTDAEVAELKSGIRWGPQGEWNALKKECVSQNIAEYTYELCFFDKVTQRQQGRKSGGTSLGKFHSWNEDAGPGSEDFYNLQVYTKGQRCWNGPERSADVEIVCGEYNALIEVEELEKCAYKLLASSPAACHETTRRVHIRHDEL
ncbi:hypothetical protein E3Q00_03938 [Wallemia mellicola]|nr:hypothetical protein E3Q00_03938 [Wallemia mellicola]